MKSPLVRLIAHLWLWLPNLLSKFSSSSSWTPWQVGLCRSIYRLWPGFTKVILFYVPCLTQRVKCEALGGSKTSQFKASKNGECYTIAPTKCHLCIQIFFSIHHITLPCLLALFKIFLASYQVEWWKGPLLHWLKGDWKYFTWVDWHFHWFHFKCALWLMPNPQCIFRLCLALWWLISQRSGIGNKYMMFGKVLFIINNRSLCSAGIRIWTQSKITAKWGLHDTGLQSGHDNRLYRSDKIYEMGWKCAKWD